MLERNETIKKYRLIKILFFVSHCVYTFPKIPRPRILRKMTHNFIYILRPYKENDVDQKLFSSILVPFHFFGGFYLNGIIYLSECCFSKTTLLLEMHNFISSLQNYILVWEKINT